MPLLSDARGTSADPVKCEIENLNSKSSTREKWKMYDYLHEDMRDTSSLSSLAEASVWHHVNSK